MAERVGIAEAAPGTGNFGCTIPSYGCRPTRPSSEAHARQLVVDDVTHGKVMQVAVLTHHKRRG